MKSKISRISFGVTALLILSLALLLAQSRNASAQTPPLHVISSVGVRPALSVILPRVEKAIGRKVTMEYDASKVLKDKILAGEDFDVVILTTGDVDALIQQGKVASNTRKDFARTGIGIGIRAGGKKPDIRTPETFKQAVLNAKSIALNPNGASTLYFNKAMSQLGIADSVKGKYLTDTDLEHFSADLTERKADILVALTSEIMSLKGVELAGPLPGELQTYINFDVATSTNTHSAEAAKAFIKSITSSSTAPVLKSKGLEAR